VPVANYDQACDAIEIHELDHVPLPGIDEPKNTQAPISQAPRETGTFNRGRFAAAVAVAKEQKLPIEPMPPAKNKTLIKLLLSSGFPRILEAKNLAKVIRSPVD
jgi:hypothetical protein